MSFSPQPLQHLRRAFQSHARLHSLNFEVGAVSLASFICTMYRGTYELSQAPTTILTFSRLDFRKVCLQIPGRYHKCVR